MSDLRPYRLPSLDVLRGLVMVLMALDHVRDFVFLNVTTADPLSDPAVPLPLYLTRWITHFCAPVFMYLAGASAGLMATRRTPHAMARFLLTRGIWLIAADATLISAAITFQPFGIPELGGRSLVMLQTLWAIGVGMAVLAAAQYLGAGACLLIGAGIAAGHNLLDPGWPGAGLLSHAPAWLAAIHAPASHETRTLVLDVSYPVLPWIGVVLLGFGTAGVFRLEPGARSRALLVAGTLMTLIFLAVRKANGYGDPHPWSGGDGPVRLAMSFLNTSKYPPSVLYLLMTLGPAAIVCSTVDRWHQGLQRVLAAFGRVPFAFYAAHFYLAHLLAVAIGLLQGFPPGAVWTCAPFYPRGFGLPLPGVYLTWMLLLAMLYPLCRWYAAVKARRTDWWLSYL